MVTFLVAAALLVAVFAAAPLAAHLLRRGRAEEREFPPASLVPAHPPIAHRRSRLQDRVLLALRISLVLALALLGSTPLVRCSRLTLTRDTGASIALALVVDDSLSMRAITKSGQSRWQLAISGAQELLRSAREGDAVAIVLGGRPARLALAATTDLDAARRTLEELSPSDRSTELADAVQIARSALQQLPHVDRRVVLLSDLADDPIPPGEPPVWAPLDAIRRPMNNCGIASAERRGRRVTAELACASSSAARGRRLQVVAVPSRGGEAARLQPETPTKGGEILAETTLVTRAGTQTVSLELPGGEGLLGARLVGGDALARDDIAPVGSQSASLAVAVVADPAVSSVVTGGPTLVEQALGALARGATVSPLALVPDDGRQLQPFAAVVLDDPPGLPAEARMALTGWVEHGGVALALLGPQSDSAQLGSSLEPFCATVVGWELAPKTPGLDPKSVGFMGGEALDLSAVAPRGRAELDGATLPGGRVVARWQDGRAFMVEREVGQGLTLTAGLPASVSVSDFALRPGFLALLDYVLDRAVERAGPKRSVAGTTWRFSGAEPVEISGPAGPLSLRDAPALKSNSEQNQPERFVTVGEAGRYLVTVGGETQERIVTAEGQEMSRQPEQAGLPDDRLTAAGTSPRADASSPLALAVLGLLALELLLRIIGHFGGRRRRLPGR